MSDSRPKSRWGAVRAMLELAWFRFRHTLGWSGKGDARFRKPTHAKQAKNSWLFLFMGGMFLVQGFWMTGRMIDSYAERALSTGGDEIALNEMAYRTLRNKEKSWSTMSDEEIEADMSQVSSWGRYSRERMSLPVLEPGEMLAVYREKGFAGFQNYEAISKGGMTLEALKGGEKIQFARLMGMIFLGLLVSLLFMPLAMRQKNLAATSDHQEWLFSLPMRESELLTGTFVSSVLIRPLVYLILWPLLTNLLLASGYQVFVSALLALGLALLVAIVISGLDVLLDTWMRARAPGWVLKNAQMIFSVLGLLSFYAVLAACLAGGPSFPWVNWLAVRFPGDLGQPLGELMLSSPGVMFFWSAVGALVLGFGSCVLAGRFMRSGWLSGNGLHSQNRGIEGARLKGGSLLKFEGLLLLRDRTLAMQVILVPMLIVGYQVLINPSMVQSVTAAGICAMAYACGTYGSLITAPQLLMSEAKGVWLIYNLPVPVAAYFRRRETLWRTVATGIGVILVLVMIWTSGAFRVEDLWRYVAALLGVWVMGRVVSGVVMGRPQMPDVASGGTPNISPGRMYGAMMIAGVYGGLLWQGLVWPVVSALVIFWFLGVAIWQRRNVSFSYLMEPVEEEPPSWGVDDGLWAVVMFFVVQVGVGVIGAMSGVMTGGLVLASFVAGGLAAILFVWVGRKRKGIPLPEIPDDGERRGWKAMTVETGVATILCLVVGVAWTKVLETGIFGDLGAAGFEWNPVILILLVVVAAPILEELLFRGFMCRTMLAFWSKRNAILGSALIFAVIHPGTSFPPVFLVGIATAVLYLRSRSVVPGMILHALYNLGIVGMALF